MLQLDRLLEPNDEFKIDVVKNRISSAFDWFSSFLVSIKSEIESKIKSLQANKIAKKHLPSFNKLLLNISIKQKQMFQSLEVIKAMYEGRSRSEILEITEQKVIPDPVSQFNKHSSNNQGSSKNKIPSAAISLQFYREGKSIQQIATIRSLAISTIHDHLLRFIETGEVKITDIIEAGKIDVITNAMDKVEGGTLKPVKDMLGPDFSYAEIKAVFHHIKYINIHQVALN